jgi:hypothetical protein
MTDFCPTCKFVRTRTDKQLVAGGRTVRTVTRMVCLFGAPSPQIDGTALALWPEVGATDWCGEWTVGPRALTAAVTFAGAGFVPLNTASDQMGIARFAGAGSFQPGGRDLQAAIVLGGVAGLAADSSVGMGGRDLYAVIEFDGGAALAAAADVP